MEVHSNGNPFLIPINRNLIHKDFGSELKK